MFTNQAFRPDLVPALLDLLENTPTDVWDACVRIAAGERGEFLASFLTTSDFDDNLHISTVTLSHA